MKVTCPACGAQYDLIAAINDTDARRFMALVSGLHPQVARPLIQYLGLFRPKKSGMRWSRMLSLARELEPMIREARITRNGISYVVPLDAWADALQYLADRPPGLKLPLKTHGYLLEILAGRAEKAAAKKEAEHEAQRRRRATPTARQNGPAQVGKLIEETTQRSMPPPGWADCVRRPKPEERNDDETG